LDELHNTTLLSKDESLDNWKDGEFEIAIVYWIKIEFTVEFITMELIF